MHLTLVEPERIPQEWEAIAPLIAPSLLGDDDLEAVRHSLGLGALQAWRVSDGAQGYIITTAGPIAGSGQLGFWLAYAGGSIEGGPKARASAVRELVSRVEHAARACGCAELRIEGRLRPWGRLLPDFHRDDIVLRKVL